MKVLKLSTLRKTWLIDIDGVMFVHNNYLKEGKDILVRGFKIFFEQIDMQDYIILLTSREEKYKELTLRSLRKYKIRYNKIIFGLPKGERILINDKKPMGLKTAVALNTKRDNLERIKIIYCKDI